MNLQARLIWLLSPLVNNAVWWDQQPDAFPPMTSFILLSTSGGQAGVYVEQKLPDHRHARVQVAVFAPTPDERERLALLVEKTLCEAPYFPACEPNGAYISGSIPSHKMYSAIQSFGIWYKPL